MFNFIAGLLVAAFTGYITYRVQEERLKRELRTEFMAEQVVRKLLLHESWKMRSFLAIEKRLGGFEQDELRKLLIRSGAVRFENTNGEEMWGLIEKNKDKL